MSARRLLWSVLLVGSLPLPALAQGSTIDLDRAERRSQKALAKLRKTLKAARNKVVDATKDLRPWFAYTRALQAVEAEQAKLHAIEVKRWRLARKAEQLARESLRKHKDHELEKLRRKINRLEDEGLMQARSFDTTKKRLQDTVEALHKAAKKRQTLHATRLAAAKDVERRLRDRLHQLRKRRIRQLLRDLDRRTVKLGPRGKTPREVLAELTRRTGSAHTLPQADLAKLPASLGKQVEGLPWRAQLDRFAAETRTTWRREGDRIAFHLIGKERRSTSGLRIQDLVVATEGRGPRRGDTLVLHYTLWIQGKLIDSSRDRGTPLRVVVGGGKVIKGFAEGISGMRAGSKRRLVVPPSLGYGAKGKRPVVPPNATLVFEVEALELVRQDGDDDDDDDDW